MTCCVSRYRGQLNDCVGIPVHLSDLGTCAGNIECEAKDMMKVVERETRHYEDEREWESRR